MRLRKALRSPGAGFFTLMFSRFFLEFWLILPRRMCFPQCCTLRMVEALAPPAAWAEVVEKRAEPDGAAAT